MWHWDDLGRGCTYSEAIIIKSSQEIVIRGWKSENPVLC